jgi:small ligand-binding sensory domain FIST
MQCRTTHQWVGDDVDSQTALVLAFSGGPEIQQVVMHGCRPVSAYHQVTKTDHNVILEIDGRPALDVVSELLGPESGRSWRDYSFFVTLGVNKGDRHGALKPEMYANRMCMNVDLARQGLIMFEPDLHAGDLFQLMLREIDLSYISGSIRSILAKNAPRKPIFALYIDCAGRACAYSHMDEEEATYVQGALEGVCPLLGFYSGVEIARMAGKPQALDWTGVLCLFYEREVPTRCAPIRLKTNSASTDTRTAHSLMTEAKPSKKELLEALACGISISPQVSKCVSMRICLQSVGLCDSGNKGFGYLRT